MDLKQVPDQVFILVQMIGQGAEVLSYNHSPRQWVYVSGLKALTSNYHSKSLMLRAMTVRLSFLALHLQ